MVKMTALCICFSVFCMAAGCGAQNNFAGHKGDVRVPGKTVSEVLKEHTRELMSVPGVIGTAEGLCDNRPCIKVYVDKRSPEIDEKIPHSIEGYPVEVEVTGKFHTMPNSRD
jgi:hypothetical protein